MPRKTESEEPTALLRKGVHIPNRTRMTPDKTGLAIQFMSQHTRDAILDRIITKRERSV